MLTENRKRRRGSDSEEGQQVNPNAKRSGGAHDLIVSDLGRDVWDSEQSSSSDSSGVVSSPERGGGGGGVLCPLVPQSSLSPQPGSEDSAGASLQGFHGNGSSSSSSGVVSYHHINRLLREAHFSSLLIRAAPGST